MKLLIAEDNKNMREMIKSMFEEYFNNIYECEDGISAVEKYREHNPDWVFMDIKMENMDGIEATNRIKGDFPDAKIIVVTDFNDKSFRKKSSEAGAVSYVLKENLSELYDIIKKTMKG